ncbi:MAG: element excision factor XisI family protein [Blastocatellia bacterium]
MSHEDTYRDIMQRIIVETASELSIGNQARILPVCDPVHDEYLLVSLGEINQRREHAIVFHARLQGAQVLVVSDGTEDGLTGAMVQAGIAAADIQQSWAPPPSVRDEAPIAA